MPQPPAAMWLRRGLTWREASGACGDLGTLLPLLIGMVQACGLDLGTSLVLTGLASIGSGIAFGIPMPIQPMKTIVAQAIDGQISLNQALLAGAFVGAVMLGAGATGLVGVIDRAVPRSVVRGVQLQVGCKLAMKGITMALKQPQFGAIAAHAPAPAGDGANSQWRAWGGSGGLVVSVATLAVLLATTAPAPEAPLGGAAQRAGGAGGGTGGVGAGVDGAGAPTARGDAAEGAEAEDAEAGATARLLQGASSASGAGGAWGDAGQQPSACSAACARAGGAAAGDGASGSCSSSSGPGRFPTMLVLAALGVLLTLWAHPEVLRELRVGPSTPTLLRPTAHDAWVGILRGGLPQLPLTALNSVVGLSQLATATFPARDASRWRPGVVAVSVGVISLCSVWLGSVPVCHGAGGLAAQVRAGASTGAASVMLGACKVLLGLVFGSSILGLLSRFPTNLLGAMLLMSGLELAGTIRQESCPRGACLLLLTAFVGLALNDTLAGCVAGLAAAACITLVERAAVQWGSGKQGGPS